MINANLYGEELPKGLVPENLLSHDVRISFSEDYSIDVSVDVRLSRVFTRFWLVRGGATIGGIVLNALSLSPKFSALLDIGVNQIDRAVASP